MNSSPRHSVSVAAAVVDQYGRVLVIQRRDNRHWEPPGGVLELSESIIEGLKREVCEETGLEIEPDRLTGVYKNMPRGVIALVFRAHLVGGSEQTSVETTRIDWWTAEDIRQRMDEAYAIRMLDALTTTDAAVRAHDGVKLLPNLAGLPNYTCDNT